MRLVDLHCDWLRQYAAEVDTGASQPDPERTARLGRLDGYLLGTSMAVLAGSLPRVEHADPWRPLGLLLARYESEFTGRLIRDAADAALWRTAPTDGLCWGVLGVDGFDGLVRNDADLDRLPGLLSRGVRVFRPIAVAGGVLGGSWDPGDERGLTDLGRAFLDRLTASRSGDDAGPRPILDLAGMSDAAMADAMRWWDEANAASGRPLLVVSHGKGGYRDLGDPSSPAARNLAELRGRGGVFGLTPGLPGCETADELKALVDAIAAIPFEGRPGAEGLAIGADLLAVDRPIPGLDSARGLARWFERTFDRETSAAIVARNARRLLLRSAAPGS